MRILVMANIGLGLFKFRQELLKELAIENEVYFCIPRDEFVEGIQRLGCQYIPCESLDRRSTNPIKDLQLFREYRTILRENHPDVVLTYTIKPNVYGGLACRRQKIPYLVNVTGLGTTLENGGILAQISKSLYRIGIKDAACVFFQNKENQQQFIDQRIAVGKTRLIPGSGVNVNAHQYEPYPSENKGFHFLFVGRIMKDKGIEELLSAIKEIREERKDVVLDVVGFCDEDYSFQLSDAEARGDIIYHGMQRDVHPYYTSCHCAVLPSYHEGMANVMLEASSTGRPVITTTVPGCKETFDEGVTGFGCDAKNKESLKEAMIRILSLSHIQREKMGKEARKKMTKEFDRNIVIQSYKEELSLITES